MQLNLPQVEENDVAIEGNDLSALPVSALDSFEEEDVSEQPESDDEISAEVVGEVSDPDRVKDVNATVSGG